MAVARPDDATPPVSTEPTVETHSEGPPHIPTVTETVRTAVNALLASSGDLRRLSVIAVAFGVVLVAAPLISALAYSLALPLMMSFGAADDPLPWLLGLAALAGFVAGVVGLFVFTVQFPLLVVAVVGGRISGHPLDLRQGLRRARQVFWRAVGASIVVSLAAALPAGVIGLVAATWLGPETQLSLGVNVLVSVVLSSPWVYVLPGLVLGGVGALEAVRRSWRLARFRWRLAVTIALLGVVGGQIVIVAALSAIGAVLTVASFTPGGPELATDSGSLLIFGAVLAGAVVVTSLSFATQAVQVAPQTSGFYALTRYAVGLDQARAGPPEPLLRRPARVIYPIGVLATIALAVGLLGSWPISERGPWQRVEVEGLSFEVPAGWQAEQSVLTASFSNGSDGRLSIRLGGAAGSIEDLAGRHFMAFGLPVEETAVTSSEDVALEGEPVREVAVSGSLFSDLPVRVELRALVESGRIGSLDAAVVVSYPSSDGPVADFYLGEAKRFARHIWLSATRTL